MLQNQEPEKGSESPSSTLGIPHPSSGCCFGGYRYEMSNTGRLGVRPCECYLLQTFTSSVGSGFADKGFMDYTPSNESQVVALKALQDNPWDSYYLFGDYGAGKTHLLVGQYRYFAESHWWEAIHSYYIGAVTLKKRMIRDMQEGIDSIPEMLDNLKIKRLFIDDLDKVKFTDWTKEQLFEIFDTVDKRKLQISITANVSPRQIEDEIGGPEGRAIGARIERICKVLELKL